MVGNGTIQSCIQEASCLRGCTSGWLQGGRSSACASGFSTVTKYKQTHPTLALIVKSVFNLFIHIYEKGKANYVLKGQQGKQWVLTFIVEALSILEK